MMNLPGTGIIFPFMTLLCIPARLYLLPKFFEGWELVLLDGEDENIEEWIEAKETSMEVNDMESGFTEDKKKAQSIRTQDFSDSSDEKPIEEED